MSEAEQRFLLILFILFFYFLYTTCFDDNYGRFRANTIPEPTLIDILATWGQHEEP